VRGLLKGSIAVVLSALVCVAMAPGAMAARAPEQAEGVYLELTPRRDVQVLVEVHPEIGVALITTQMGFSQGGPRSRNGSVQYAARIPKDPLEGKLDVTVPGVASIVGDLTPSGGGLEFSGTFHFTGNGGYLSFDTEHATGGKLSGPVPCPDGCRRSEPSLFEYIYNPFGFFGDSTQILYSEQSQDGRVIRFQATHSVDGRLTDFDVKALEWLPGPVAVVRGIELGRAAGSSFKVSSKAEHPKAAKIRPPTPFSGSANYRSAGGIRSTASGKLTGSLSVDIYGVKVRIAGPRTTASLFNLNPGF
jgi:hypothetical protein